MQSRPARTLGTSPPPCCATPGRGWVILGHSERRAEHHELDETVRQKTLAAICRRADPDRVRGRNRRQAQRRGPDAGGGDGSFRAACRKGFAGVVAYEPVWAIGTGKSATEADVEAMHAFIRAELVRQFPAGGAAVRILYGGSVKPGNAAGLLALPDVGGALVGGASLVAADFLAIAAAARSGRVGWVKPIRMPSTK